MLYFYLPKPGNHSGIHAAVVTAPATGNKGRKKSGEPIVSTKQIKIVINPICCDIEILLI